VFGSARFSNESFAFCQAYYLFLPSPVIIHGRHRVFGLCVIKIVSMKSYRLLTGISPSFQVRCRWEHR